LCFWFVQITRTTPARRTILHLSQIFFTDALTFIARLRSASLAKLKTAKTVKSQAASRPFTTAQAFALAP
jgi:hypothetical protein